MKSKYKPIHLATLALSICMFVVILFYADWDKIDNYISRINIFTVSAIFILLLAMAAFRAIRIECAISSKLSFWQYYLISMRHTFYLSVYPARLGEISFVNIMHRLSYINWSKIIKSLFLIRLHDLLMLVLLYVASSIFLDIHEKHTVYILFFLILFLIILSIFYINSIYAFLSHRAANKPNSIINHITILLEKFFPNNYESSTEEKKKYRQSWMLILTFLIWLSMSMLYGVTFYSFDLTFKLMELIYIVCIVSLSSIIPIQTIGGVGVKDAALIFSLSTLGESAENAVTIAVTARLVIYFSSLLLSAFFLIFMLDNKKK